MKTPDYLDQAKLVLNLESDYSLAPRLGITRSYMSKLRLGKNALSDELAVSIAQIIGVPAAIVLADAHIEREQNPSVKAAYVAMAEMLKAGVKAGIKAGFNALVEMTVAGKLARV